MVSSLSARLLGGCHGTVSSSDSHTSSQKSRVQNSARTTSTTISGYSADQESVPRNKNKNKPPQSNALPGYVGLYNKHKRRPSDAEEHAKRRQMNELIYAAATAKSDLSTAGIDSPILNRKRARISPHIDISNVNLEFSSSSASNNSPHWVNRNSGWTSGRYEILTDFGAAYKDMILQTASAYQPGVVTPYRSRSPGSYSDSSSSSLSDTESDDSQAAVNNVLVLHARLEDRDLEDRCQLSDNKEEPIRHFVSCPSTVSIPMEEALSICKSPRLVTLSMPPYRVVFCNAAYSIATGFSSIETLGKSVRELVTPVKEQSNHLLCLELCAASSSDGHDANVHCQSCNDTLKDVDDCTAVEWSMKVTPIMSRRVVPLKQGCDALGDLRELNNITHFSVDLGRVQLHQNSASSSLDTAPVRTTERPAFVSALG